LQTPDIDLSDLDTLEETLQMIEEAGTRWPFRPVREPGTVSSRAQTAPADGARGPALVAGGRASRRCVLRCVCWTAAWRAGGDVVAERTLRGVLCPGWRRRLPP
jgi:hypothetical protein